MIYLPLSLLMLSSIFADIHGLNEICTKNSDCETKGAICIDSKCICDGLSYYNNTQCLPYATEYGSICYESAQCDWLGENSDCLNNRCVCQSSFRWYKGKCLPYVDKGEKCTTNDDCYNGYDLLSLSCNKGICACREGYYDRGYDCRKTSRLIFDGDCALNIDCESSSLIPLVCNLGKCGKSNTQITNIDLSDLIADQNEEKPMIHADPDDEIVIPCITDDDCKDMANSLCNTVNNTCGCIEETQYLHQGNCVHGISACTADEDCNTPNSMCFKSTTCICKQGFFLNNGQCIAELGMKDPTKTYSKDSDCPIKPGKVVDSICYCKNYWFNDEPNRNCIKTMIQSTHTCLTNEWCYAMGPYAFCNSTNSQCSCSHIATFNESTYYCEPHEEPPNDFCLRDKDCGLNERCLDETCACLENFERNDDNKCVPDIGASCLLTGCSHIGNSSCTSGECRCKENYIGKVNRCLKKAENLLDSCEEQEQCENIEHAVCGISEDDEEEEVDGKKCVCGEDFTTVSERCYQIRRYGDPCVTESDCTLVLNHSYQCRNSICQCPVGQKLKNGYCTSSSEAISLNFTLLLLVVFKFVVS